MARPREFNNTEVLENAMNVFWSKGFEGAHLSALTDATGLSKSSLYGAFGSKRKLYLAALDHYTNGRACLGSAGIIAAHDCPVTGVKTLFESFIDSMMDQKSTRGCFVNQCAGEAAPDDEEVTARLADAFEEVEQAIRAAIVRGQKQGHIAPEKDPVKLARFLVASLQGLIVVGKCNPDRNVLEDIAEAAMSIMA